MLDKLGRNIDYLRVSLTDRCNLRCVYCMPEKGVEKLCHKDILRLEEVLKIIKAFEAIGIKKVRFTGGEPLLVNGIEKLIYETSKLKGIKEIALTTNAILLEEMASELKKSGLNRVNISLDSLREDRFDKITRGGSLKKVFAAIDKCLEIGLAPVKLNTVVIRGINDDEIGDFINLTKELPVEVRFIELMPIGEGRTYYPEGHISCGEIIERYSELIPLPVEKSKTALLYKIANAKGKVGFITPLSCKFCSSCNRVRLTSVGTLKPCLHSSEEIDIKQYIDNELRLLSEIRKAVYGKPGEHNLDTEGVSSSARDMFQIGG
jgi:cyclic pyranopterin phosphate synthase